MNKRQLNINIIIGLEKKRTSITRLKQPPKFSPAIVRMYALKRKEPRLRDWNTDTTILAGLNRILEKKRTSITRLKHGSVLWKAIQAGFLEKKRTSITRLKLRRSVSTSTAASMTWKEKNLDYEIETDAVLDKYLNLPTWKEKNLDYEIETLMCVDLSTYHRRLEKKRTSITRLKQYQNWFLWQWY